MGVSLAARLALIVVLVSASCSVLAGDAKVPPDVFPIGIYSVPEADLADVVSAGFNCTVNYTTDPDKSKEYMEAAEKAGLEVGAYALHPQQQVVEPNGEKKVAQAIAGRKDLPNLLAWYLTDEPELNKQSPELIQRLESLVKKHDPRHLTCLVVARPDDYAKYAKIADVFMVDPYPIPNEPISTVYKRVSLGIVAAGGKPVWCIPQSFSWQVWHGKQKPGDVHRPTPEEVRNMTYQALVAGARGIIYWVYKGSRYYVRDYPEQWEADKRMARELNAVAPVIAYGKDDPSVQLTSGAGVRTMSKVYDGRKYLFVVNLTRQSRHAEVSASGASRLKDLFGGEGVTGSNGRFSMSLESIGARVFQVE